MAADPFKEFTVKRKKGETIYVEGDLGTEMYVVQSGAVRIFRAVGGVKQELAIMEKGDFFGEIAVLEGLPRTASAEAANPYLVHDDREHGRMASLLGPRIIARGRRLPSLAWWILVLSPPLERPMAWSAGSANSFL